MNSIDNSRQWIAGTAPVAVIMISLNEAHNMREVLENLKGWAQEVYLVDSYSSDKTIDLALEYGVKIVQRKFSGFGDQWNFALSHFKISAAWTMKLDPDERLTDQLKQSIHELILENKERSIIIERRLWFFGKILPVKQSILRLWRTGLCRFTEVAVNEYPVVEGNSMFSKGYLEHHDSPNLEHWISKQNKYTSAEALSQFLNAPLALNSNLFGSQIERRMWLKRNFWKFPGRYVILFIYHFLFIGAWRAGKIGLVWSHLRVEVYRMWEYKCLEMQIKGLPMNSVADKVGLPDDRVAQAT